jgi:hypothetical protein
MNIKALTLGLLIAASPAFAADIDGKWTGTVDTPNGAVEVSYMFKAEGEVLTGTTLSPDGSTSIPIANGKISGNKISFSLSLDFGGGPTTFEYAGEASGSDLLLKTSFMNMPIEMKLKKS